MKMSAIVRSITQDTTDVIVLRICRQSKDGVWDAWKEQYSVGKNYESDCYFNGGIRLMWSCGHE